MIDKDGEWEVHSGYRLLVKPSVDFETRREQSRIQSEKAEAERAVVQAERSRCIAYLKKKADLTKVNLAKTGLTTKSFSEATLEMSFEDIIESVRCNREAALKEVSS